MKKFIYIVMAIVSLCFASCSSSSKLEIAVATSDAECPMVVDEDLTITHITTEGENVVYECVVKESDYLKVADLDTPDVREELKKGMKSGLLGDTDSETREFRELVKDAGYNIIFRYIGENTGSQFDIKIFNHEI